MYTGIVVARSKKEIEIGILSFVAENVPNRGNLCHHKIVVTFFLLSSMYRSARPMPAYIKKENTFLMTTHGSKLFTRLFLLFTLRRCR